PSGTSPRPGAARSRDGRSARPVRARRSFPLPAAAKPPPSLLDELRRAYAHSREASPDGGGRVHPKRMMRRRRRCGPLGDEAVEQHERILCRLSIRDDSYVHSLLTDHAANLSASGLDAKSHALAQLAALVASDAAPPSYLQAIDWARSYDASDDEI